MSRRIPQSFLNELVARSDLLELIGALNRDDRVHGILVQLPLPKHIDPRKVIEAIDPDKDVDGFHPVNVGRLAAGENAFVPCTPAVPRRSRRPDQSVSTK